MSGFQCPYCSMVMPIVDATKQIRLSSFENESGQTWNKNGIVADDSCLQTTFYQCPNCGQYTIKTIGIGKKVKDVNMLIRPLSLAKQFPDYIPPAIRNDYEEACAIVNLSPKSSATLARRCLQGMIRDFWGISKARLVDEISALESKIPATQWKVISSIRKIGNIGAHMEKDINLIVDIEPDEAQKLIKLIEHLLEQWYINRHDQELLYADIIGIDESKQTERKKTE